MSTTTRLALLIAATVLARPAPGTAQESVLADECAVLADDARRFCNLVGNAILAAQPPIGLAATGGNPVPGTASTLGIRIGTTPRVSVAGRLGAVHVEAPRILDRASADSPAFLVPSAAMDIAVGLFGGLSPAPTVGGMLSVDALAHAGLVLLPTGEGFRDGGTFAWGVGARLGVFRESFTLPGVSVSAMRHGLGHVAFGDPALAESDGFFESDLGVWSLRAALTKRILLLGVTAGIGFDRYTSATRFGIDTGAGTRTFAVDGLDVDRVSAFVNAQWTMLVLHLVAEAGWQAGAGAFPAGLPAGGGVEDGSFFGGLALRLSI